MGWVQGVGLLDRVTTSSVGWWSTFFMASRGQEEPFPDWPWLCDESSPVTTQKGSAHSCSNFGGKIQNGAPIY